jgi:nitric oxide reductase subunit B
MRTRRFFAPPLNHQKRKQAMHATRRLWTWLAIICVLSFATLLMVGREIYLKAPPIPGQVLDNQGHIIYTGEQIKRGQQAWLAAGGQQLGTVWGHGSYVAPDWSADWLHREAVTLQDLLARRDHGLPYARLDAGARGAVDALVHDTLRRNTYDPAGDTLTLSADRSAAVQAVAAHYAGLFGTDPALDKLREQYAMNAG